MGAAPRTCEQRVVDHRREDAIPTAITEGTNRDSNTSRTRGRVRANTSVKTQGVKPPPPLAAGRPRPRCCYGDIARFTAVAVAAALEGARRAHQRQANKLLETGGRRWGGKGRWQ